MSVHEHLVGILAYSAQQVSGQLACCLCEPVGAAGNEAAQSGKVRIQLVRYAGQRSRADLVGNIRNAQIAEAEILGEIGERGLDRIGQLIHYITQLVCDLGNFAEAQPVGDIGQPSDAQLVGYVGDVHISDAQLVGNIREASRAYLTHGVRNIVNSQLACDILDTVNAQRIGDIRNAQAAQTEILGEIRQYAARRIRQVVNHISDTVMVMYLGHQMELASKDELYANPLHPYTKALLDVVPRIRTERIQDKRILEGDVPSPTNPPAGCCFHTRCPFATERCANEVPASHEAMPNHFCACHLYE